MRLGLMVFGSDTGLGNQTRDYFRHLDPAVILGVDISSLNKRVVHKDWYPADTRWTSGIPTNEDCEYLVDRSDVILVAETPLNYHLFKYAKEKGVKTVLIYNYEFLDYLSDPNLPMPSLLISPSSWHIDEVANKYDGIKPVLKLHHPVDREALPFRKFNEINTFVHVAGQKLYEDRNGTDLLLEAIPKVKSQDIEFLIFSQHDLPNIKDPRVRKMELNIKDYSQLYKYGECLILPRRYGGQTLQMNEAMSCGMIPLMLDCPPNDDILPGELLVPVTGSKKIMTRTEIDCFTTDPQILADSIDRLANMGKREVRRMNRFSDEYADAISWKKIKGSYLAILEATCMFPS